MPSLRTPPGLSINMNGTYSPRPSLSNMDLLRNEYDAVVEAERRRHDFVENLMITIQSLTSERDEALKKFSRAEFTCDSYQTRLDNAERKIEEMQKAIDCDRFVLVLIDGDNTLFLDEYIKDGASGGERAARDLHQSIFDHLKDKPYFQHDYNILVRVYANLHGLSKTYTEARIVPNSKVLLDFVQTFNKSHDLVEIVDAGNDKEAADSKIKATFSLYRRNLHCKHILFSGSGDNSYAGFLRQYVPVEGVSQHITLIEALPFAMYLQPLSHKFQTASFPRIFRDTKISATRMLNQEHPRASPPEQHAVPSHWSTATMKAALPTIERQENIAPPSVATQPTPAPPVAAPTGPFVWVNRKGQRVDKPISKDDFDKETVNKIKSRKYCNKHWLLGKCEQGEWCTHKHDGTLSSQELENLRFVARMRPCATGLECWNPDCFDGHRCQYGMKCVKKECWFTDEMHEVEVVGVMKAPVKMGPDYEYYRV